MMKKSALLSIQAFALVLLFSMPALSGSGYKNEAALEGISQAKIYFDVTHVEAAIVQLRMNLVERTIEQLENEGIEVEAIIGFRGPASRYITAGNHYVLEEDRAAKAKIGEWVTSLLARGVVIEQCSIAADMQDISHNDFLPGITIVENGYISLVGYQLRGFAVVPMD